MVDPCTVPPAENGDYFFLPITDADNFNQKPDSSSLNPMTAIDNGQMIAFQCNEGYNIQGPRHLRCWNSEWSVTEMPTCIPMPCLLPRIPNISYQGGYRAGLTIAHGSSVFVQCDITGNTTPIQLGMLINI